MLQPIGNLVQASLKRQGIEKQVEASQVVKIFHEVISRMFGKKILKLIQAKSLKNKTLNIASLSTVATSELRLHEETILDQINSSCQKTLVEKLRFYM